jgi:hypothetical protein
MSELKRKESDGDEREAILGFASLSSVGEMRDRVSERKVIQ